MPAMDEGAFILDYWAPSGTPLAQTEKMARDIEKILSKNPDVEAYVRRTGAENGLFATQTSRGDIQVALRPAEDDPISLLTKPVRPPLEDLEKELKNARQEARRPGHAKCRSAGRRYRRRPLHARVMDEIEDEIKDNFAEHQLKIELIQIMEDELNDLSGANKPIEVKLFGPDHKELRRLAEQVGEMLEKEGQGPRHQGGQQQRPRRQPGPDDPGGRCEGRPARAEAGRGRPAAQGDLPGPDRDPGAGIVGPDHRRARPLSGRAPLRRRPVRPRPRSSASGSCCRQRRRRAPASPRRTWPARRGPCRSRPLATVDAGAHARRAVAREPAAGGISSPPS